MKKNYFIVSVFLMTAVSLQATVHTVSNDPNKPAQFTSPTVALVAANPGDTLYVYGSPNDYFDLVIDKSITIIGAGFNTRKDIFYKTKFRFIDLPAGTFSNITIDGLTFSDFRFAPAVVNYSGITIRNSVIFGSIGTTNGGSVSCGSIFTNWLIENAFVGTGYGVGNTGCNPITPVTTGFLWKNCIIGNLAGNSIYNQTFLNSQIGFEQGSNNFNTVVSSVFNNCIFYKISFNQSIANINNQFNNCITHLTTHPSQTFDLNAWTGGASGTANNCLININPLWTNGAPSGVYFAIVNPAFPNIWNPAIQVGSLAINAGTDGTDIGLTGNIVPYNYLAEPKIPVIRRYQLVNSVVPPNGTVTIKATSTKAQ